MSKNLRTSRFGRVVASVGTVAIVILCFVPEIATWLPDTLMGPIIGSR